MINKNEAKAIVMEKIAEEKAQYEAKIKEFCDTVVTETIKAAAMDKKTSVVITCEREDRESIGNYIRVQGDFVAYHLGLDKLEIRW